MSSKKRKSTGGPSSQPAQYITNDADAPLLATFPDFPPKPQLLNFSTYMKPGDSTTSQTGKRRRIVTAETQKLEYVADNANAKPFCQYVVAIVDRNSGQITLSAAEPMRVSTVVKRQKVHENRLISEKNLAARNALGEAFGTKKRKQAIRALERNQVKADVHVEDIEETIDTKIEKKVEKAEDKTDVGTAEERGIPSFDSSATKLEDAYKLDGIISNAELRAINYHPLTTCRNAEQLKELTESMKMGSWAYDTLNRLLKGTNRHAMSLRSVLYLNWMMRMYRMRENDLNAKEGFGRRLGSAPEVVAEGLKSKFTEFAEDKGQIRYAAFPVPSLLLLSEPTLIVPAQPRYRMSPRMKDKLLSYILVLCLILNEYSLGITQLAADLKEPQTKIMAVARELGCKIGAMKGEGDVKGFKTASLVVPLKFPEQRKRNN
ncbi:DNA-directed RNA polymerase I subunit rpa49 [Rhizophlyctis rosea]|uniref:DNA-directed RNA polymerase I subunit rpa49 n=1 Tax=Rhizophlyctis rosea TaxID=64517 RepID=A0AAD5SHF6_9FUNG|nr:DNA-directed RNA polymerase I subunit rpa49 [Rhizophlyctis rosea]